ncbi:FAD-dependent oxidoreductase [Legionella cincinnatiensis]|uniref:Dihydroorotate dehydrogenase electron transfer subunit n=1 Tax=Legionella cincinnatiensis TaxID=28085 RepID=A0A378ILN2_9GAMM|nr:FAD-dependent oxidoreductase [Legionella cincinnatiensis]KTC83047.1 dihydroorotate dehydrogenase electron transfer subunit [Legionella cincinnatiensis]STX35913.1 dihydroorotate dehydrogenase electron transfer subunit [Legionella cincinnatiensis]
MFRRHEATLKNKKVRGESEVYSLEIEGVTPNDCGNGQYVVIHGDKKPIYLAIASSKNGSYLKISQILKNGAKNILSESQVDSHLEIDVPCGNEFKPVGEKVLLICAGSAESVMRNLYNNLTSEGKDVSVFYSAKRLEDLPFPNFVVRLNNNNQHYITLTEEKADQFKSGRITEHLKTKDIDPNTSVFVCGPVGFENDIVNILLDKSHPAQNIHISYWGKILPVDSDTLAARGFKIKENSLTEKEGFNESPQIKY